MTLRPPKFLDELVFFQGFLKQSKGENNCSFMNAQIFTGSINLLICAGYDVLPWHLNTRKKYIKNKDSLYNTARGVRLLREKNFFQKLTPL